MQLDVTLEEAVVIVNVLGSMPTQQGVFPLYQKLREQVEPQLKAVSEAQEQERQGR